jgi:hypothetical protein
MSLEYYLFCRKSYDKIIQELEYIINVFEDIDDFEDIDHSLDHFLDHSLDNYIDNYIDKKNHKEKTFFIKKMSNIKEIRNKFQEKIINLCCHDMVEDSIDISPDDSKNIRYCKICEYTSP